MVVNERGFYFMSAETWEPAVSVFSGGFAGLAKYAWILLPLVGIFFIGGIIWLIKKIRQKSHQWTHTLKVRRVLNDKRLSDAVIHRMRRFPLIKKAEVFELEKPLLGGYLLPELDEYSGLNEYSIILDKNNRIYTNKGEFFVKDKSSVNVSAKHAEIDIQRQNLKADFQNINKVNKRVEWATIAKWAFMIMAMVCFTILAIVGISKWGEAQAYKAQEAQAETQAYLSLAEAMETIQATVNTQKLEILPMLQEIYGTRNIRSIINQDPIIVSEPQNVST